MNATKQAPAIRKQNIEPNIAATDLHNKTSTIPGLILYNKLKLYFQKKVYKQAYR